MSKAPTFFTRGMTEEEEKAFQLSYKESTPVLRAMRARLNKELDQLILESENILDWDEMKKNAATRVAYRKLISYLPE